MHGSTSGLRVGAGRRVKRCAAVEADQSAQALLAGAGGASTATDDYRFLQMLLNGGELDGVRLLSAVLCSKRCMLEPQAPPSLIAFTGAITWSTSMARADSASSRSYTAESICPTISGSRM